MQWRDIRDRHCSWFDSRIGALRYKGRKEIDAKDRYAVPGLIDGHTHIEMSMLSVSEFAKAVVADPHEIANVFNVRGIRAILAVAKYGRK